VDEMYSSNNRVISQSPQRRGQRLAVSSAKIISLGTTPPSPKGSGADRWKES
jgi:hypothetical protein